MRTNKEHIEEFELDIHNFPPLTIEQQAELDNLDMRPDEVIDYTDIPPQDMAYIAL